MNYFIQGDAANADKIKAAFEKLGYNTAVNGWNFNGDCGVYFTNEADKSIDYTHIETFVNLIKTHPDYKELKLPVEPKFKVGDWIVKKDATTFYGGNYAEQITLIENDGYLKCIWLSSGTWLRDNDIRLWTIADAKDGDVLVTEDYIFIFKYILHGGVHLYCHYNIDDEEFELSIQDAVIGNIHDKGVHFRPATKEQRDLLFAKMREAGYEWDAGKKELRKTIDEPTFKVGDWVVTNYGKVSRVVSVDNDGDGYTLDDGVYFSGSWCDMYHLWSIADAKDGDILSAKIDGDGYILIFKQIKDGWIETYGHYYITIDKFCAPTQMFCRNYQGRLYPATQEQYRTLFKKMHDDGYEWDFGKKELRRIIKPKFKVGDWIVRNDGSSYVPVQIYNLKKDRYIVTNMLGSKGKLMINRQDEWRLWTIEDAKDGDVLYFNDNTIVVFKDLYNSTTFHSYCHIEDDLFEISEDEMPDWWESKGFTPATKEQCDLLFAKMKEVGYQWDVDKKELRKIKSHYDIANFHAGMPVLVRADNNCRWDYSVFSRITGNEDWPFAVCNGVSFTQCIPFEGNEYLLGTTDMPDEMYINW